MTEQIKEWIRNTQNPATTVIIVILTAIIGTFMTGLWMDLSSIQHDIANQRTELSQLREALPKDYTSLLTYLQDKAIIRVHDEAAQKYLYEIQTALALSNQKMDALTATMQDYRKEYRQDNPYVNEHVKKIQGPVKNRP